MKLLALALTLLATPALAQPQAPQSGPPDPAFLQRAVSALQGQRNAALDAQAALQAQLAQLADENTKLKAEIEELKKPVAK